ncbi:hypothetical protein [Paenibacillus illinoisensis]|uniref:hypothetical protein n=1 Tax=Paenibacillus illinoisensis TaxID=59845 RepID=UPI0030164D7D
MELLLVSVTAVIVFVLAIILGSLLVSLKNKIRGRYLNRYYAVSTKGEGVYELHFTPVLGFYYASPRKYFHLRMAAEQKFKVLYPDMSLISITVTLHRYYEKRGIHGALISQTRISRFVNRQMNYFIVLCNLANYKKRTNSEEWRWLHLFKRIRNKTPRKYWIIDCREHEES